jgi:hypothetical protein
MGGVEDGLEEGMSLILPAYEIRGEHAVLLSFAVVLLVIRG